MRNLWPSFLRPLPKLGLTSAVSLSVVLACTGSEFSAGNESCADAACAGESASSGGKTGAGGKAGMGGKAGSAGSQAGTANGGLPNIGGTQFGGSSGSGGGGKGGVGSAGGPIAGGGIAGGEPGPSTFPVTDMLDDFNRPGPSIGISWIGAVDNYSLKEQALWCELCTSAALWSTPFSGNQEVFATLVHFDADASEINLVLKAQSSPDCELIEVLYSPASATVRIAYCSVGEWTDLEVAPLALEPGDRLGARAHSSGMIEIFANDQLIGSVDASGFPHKVGRLGVNGISGSNANLWDDFGGGEWR